MYWTLYLLAFSLVVQEHMLSPVPNDADNPEAFDDVRELESLRSENVVKPNNTENDHSASSASKAMSPDHNPESEPEPEPEPEGDPQPNSRSAIFRHRGITQAKRNKFMLEKNLQLNDGYNKFGGIQYSPTDLAAYVFSTGDEEGVAVAVEELVREGVMGRTDAINYLQDVKQVLNYLKDQYEQQKKIQEFKNRAFQNQQLAQRLLQSPPREQFMPQMMTDKRDPPKAAAFPSASVVTTEPPHPVVIASTAEPKSFTHSDSTTNRPKTDSALTDSFKDDDHKRKFKQEPETSYDFTFELIYKLAKQIFYQSMLNYDSVAGDTISGMRAYLEKEVENNRISPEMKKKVLEVVSHGMVDGLGEYIEQIRMKPDGRVPELDEESIRYLNARSGTSTQNAGMPEAYLNTVIGGHNNALSLESKSKRPKSS